MEISAFTAFMLIVVLFFYFLFQNGFKWAFRILGLVAISKLSVHFKQSLTDSLTDKKQAKEEGKA
jgi:hypothetical protein